MTNVYKQPRSVDEHISDARHGNTSPEGTSHGMRHDPTGRKGQTILATGAVNNVGRSCLNIENNDVRVLDKSLAESRVEEYIPSGPAARR